MASGVPVELAPRSATAQEGIALLKRGSQVMKYGRAGRPHPTVFKLSADEEEITWEGKKGLLGSKAKRSIWLADVLALDVGQESAVFRRQQQPSEQAHLSLSLLLLPMD